MFPCRKRNTLTLFGMLVLVMALSPPARATEQEKEKNPKHAEPYAKILRHIQILNDKVDAMAGLAASGPCDIPPVWGKKFTGPDRFVAVLDGAAYCDKETGLVWERSPATTTKVWYLAMTHCAERIIGGRKGWSLPTVEQLASLIDTSNNPALPTDHPFRNVQRDPPYWTATTFASFPASARNVLFGSGSVSGTAKTIKGHLWCVRGGQVFLGSTHTTLH